MKYLGVDYGKSKVGLAISEGTLADPLTIVAVSGLNDALSKIKRVIRDEAIDIVVIGVPESGEALKITRSFIKELSKEASVIEADETLSTQDALKINRKKEDSLAAAIILQNYLDSLT